MWKNLTTIKRTIKLKFNKKITNPHKSALFIVRNHAEIKRRKPKIVYNYKRINDNTHDIAYNLPHKDYFLNLIQHKKVFSKFDLKSG